MGEKTKDTTVKKLNQLNEIAKELDVPLATLSMAWVIRNKDVSTAITSSTKDGQLEESVKAVEVYKRITPEIEKRINEILDNTPDAGMDFRSRGPKPARR